MEIDKEVQEVLSEARYDVDDELDTKILQDDANTILSDIKHFIENAKQLDDYSIDISYPDGGTQVEIKDANKEVLATAWTCRDILNDRPFDRASEAVELTDTTAEVNRYKKFAQMVFNVQGNAVEQAFLIAVYAYHAGIIDKWSGFLKQATDDMSQQVLDILKKVHAHYSKDPDKYYASFMKDTLVVALKADELQDETTVTVKFAAAVNGSEFGALLYGGKIVQDITEPPTEIDAEFQAIGASADDVIDQIDRYFAIAWNA